MELVPGPQVAHELELGVRGERADEAGRVERADRVVGSDLDRRAAALGDALDLRARHRPRSGASRAARRSRRSACAAASVRVEIHRVAVVERIDPVPDHRHVHRIGRHRGRAHRLPDVLLEPRPDRVEFRVYHPAMLERTGGMTSASPGRDNERVLRNIVGPATEAHMSTTPTSRPTTRTHPRRAVPRARAARLPDVGRAGGPDAAHRDGDVLGEVLPALRRRLGVLRVVLRRLPGLHLAGRVGVHARSRSRRRSCGRSSTSSPASAAAGADERALQPAVRRLPPLPAPGHDEAAALPGPARDRRDPAHLARRRALRREPALPAARARRAARSRPTCCCRASS